MVKKTPDYQYLFYMYIFRSSVWSLVSSPRATVQMLKHCAKAIGFAEEAPLHWQSQGTVHNSNSCSCILILSGGLSLKGSIFLHFRNYRLAREFGLKIQEAEAAPVLAFLPSTVSKAAIQIAQ